ncbi:helix-turn-helix domain-containing protein [Aureimonas leprariae]|nr:helix-turn-helix domain-containing protein [Aureimonas leprariae]
MSHVPREPERAFGFARSGSGDDDRRAELRRLRLCRVARGIASAAFGVPEAEIQKPNRSVAASCEARHIAMYLARVIFEVPYAVIGQEFGRDRTSVSHAIRRIEDRRDDRSFEEKLSGLERLAENCLSLTAGEEDET